MENNRYLCRSCRLQIEIDWDCGDVWNFIRPCLLFTVCRQGAELWYPQKISRIRGFSWQIHWGKSVGLRVIFRDEFLDWIFTVYLGCSVEEIHELSLEQFVQDCRFPASLQIGSLFLVRTKLRDLLFPVIYVLEHICPRAWYLLICRPALCYRSLSSFPGLTYWGSWSGRAILNIQH